MAWTSPRLGSTARRAVKVGLAALLVSGIAASTGAVAAVRSKPTSSSKTTTKVYSPSVMIQLSSLVAAMSPTGLQSWLRSVCPTGVVPSGSLALQDVANANGTLLTSYLDVLAPFLPGSTTHPCFSRVYVGTVEPNWTGSGNAYVDGVQDATFVSDYLAQSSAVAKAFVQRYPAVTTDWYITYEANLNDLYYPAVSAAYQTLLTGELTSLNAIRPGRHVMWSPAFWYPYSSYSQNTLGMTGLNASLTGLFTALKTVGLGIDVVNLQDYVAGSSCQPVSNQMTPSDAVGWIGFLRSLGVIPNVQINVEQYAMDCATGGITNGNATEVKNREAYYRSNGLTLGPAFELRYWIPNHA